MGSHVVAQAVDPKQYLNDYLATILHGEPRQMEGRKVKLEFSSDEEFWHSSPDLALAEVTLKNFCITDWFPRTPGVFWSPYGRMERERLLERAPTRADNGLGEYLLPFGKMGMIEAGGVGTIRLRPRSIKGVGHWFATAVSGAECNGGVPLLIADDLLVAASMSWGDRALIRGRVKFLQEAGLVEIAYRVHHARPYIVYVDEIRPTKERRKKKPIEITPVVLFSRSEGPDGLGYTYATCPAGSDEKLDDAADWMSLYAKKFSGTVITNFDEQRPTLAAAPLSYQRLVSLSYDRDQFGRLLGKGVAEVFDSAVERAAVSFNIGGLQVGHRIRVNGPAIINIEATLKNVKQVIKADGGLKKKQKTELQPLVEKLEKDIEKVQSDHPQEAAEVAQALEKVVINANKPDEERKTSILEVSAKGLKEAASLMKDIAPTVVVTAGLIAKCILGQ